jgi:hypothetical protein
VRHGATEACNGRDDNCDGATDEGCAPPGALRVFVTSGAYAGTFALTAGGDALAGADAACAVAASAGGLGGTWHAWLSTSTTPASSRVADEAYYLVDRKTQVCANLADLDDGSIANAITLTESGQVLAGTFVWTGTVATGLADVWTCVDWTDVGNFARYGYNPAVSGDWTAFALGGCSMQNHLYCFEVR